MGIDFCNDNESLRWLELFKKDRDIDIRPLYTYLCPVIIFVCFFSISFNAILMCISRQSKFVNKSPILLLSLNLAVTDLIASLLNGLGILFNSYLPEVHEIKLSQCSMLKFEVFRYSALVASALHLLALAFVHYRGIVNPLHYRSTIFFSQHLSRTINAISVGCWLVPLTIMITWFSSIPCQGFQSNECNWMFLMGFEFRYMILTLFAMPLLLMSIIYLRIFIIISRHQKGRRINHKQSSTRSVIAAAGHIGAAAGAAVEMPGELIGLAREEFQAEVEENRNSELAARCSTCTTLAAQKQLQRHQQQQQQQRAQVAVSDTNRENPSLESRSSSASGLCDDKSEDSDQEQGVGVTKAIPRAPTEAIGGFRPTDSRRVVQVSLDNVGGREQLLLVSSRASEGSQANTATRIQTEDHLISEQLAAPAATMKAANDGQAKMSIKKCTCDNKLSEQQQPNAKLSRTTSIGSRDDKQPLAASKTLGSEVSGGVHLAHAPATTSNGQLPVSGRSSISFAAVYGSGASATAAMTQQQQQQQQLALGTGPRQAAPSGYHEPGGAGVEPRKRLAKRLTATTSASVSTMGNATTATTTTYYEPQRRHIHAGAVPQTNTKALVTTLLILGTYFISYVPAIIFQVLTCIDRCPYPLYDLPFSKRILFGALTTLLLIAKSIIDPFIYSHRMGEIRLAMNRYFSKRRSKTLSCAASMRTSQRLATTSDPCGQYHNHHHHHHHRHHRHHHNHHSSNRNSAYGNKRLDHHSNNHNHHHDHHNHHNHRSHSHHHQTSNQLANSSSFKLHSSDNSASASLRGSMFSRTTSVFSRNQQPISEPCQLQQQQQQQLHQQATAPDLEPHQRQHQSTNGRPTDQHQDPSQQLLQIQTKATHSSSSSSSTTTAATATTTTSSSPLPRPPPPPLTNQPIETR